jgi:hypothetical protein
MVIDALIVWKQWYENPLSWKIFLRENSIRKYYFEEKHYEKNKLEMDKYNVVGWGGGVIL